MGILLTFKFLWNMIGALILMLALAHFLLKPRSRKVRTIFIIAVCSISMKTPGRRRLQNPTTTRIACGESAMLMKRRITMFPAPWQ